MQAKTPEDVDNLFFEAMNRGDIDAAVNLHEPDARWCAGTPGRGNAA
jgi:hypothetical protein